jgi:uncharacterized repeat protein (TIGR03803 family)
MTTSKGSLILTIVILLVSISASAQTESVLYYFTGRADGFGPNGPLVRDSKGNFYGTTLNGGTMGYGTAFEVTPNGTGSVLHSFSGSANAYPNGGLIFNSKGDLYGTTYGGVCNRRNCPADPGIVFELTTKRTEKIVYRFTKAPDGEFPSAGLVMDSQGNLYGTTSSGGEYQYGGAVFEVSPKGVETILHSFTRGGPDGSGPNAALIRDSLGNLYGTTVFGGAYNNGTVFKITASGSESVLYSFAGGNDGAYPYGGLVTDSTGNLYGTTQQGGGNGYYGTIFELTPNGVENVLYSFTGGTDGAYPSFGLVRDSEGNLYGTTTHGGGCCGTVFELSKEGVETVLYRFMGTGDGAYPGAVILDSNGELYGTTYGGGNSDCSGGCGVIFEITP